MYNRARELRSDIKKARDEIIRLFVKQCRDGAQSKDLGSGQCACGQFLAAPNKRQHGLHGTAAALRVVGSADDLDAGRLAPCLVKYLERRPDKERGGKAGKEGAKIRQDERNVIKISEVLLALRDTKPKVPREPLQSRLADKLKQSMTAEGGWPYFTDSPDEPSALLPTAWASAAMQAFGHRDAAEKSAQYIFREISKFDSESKLRQMPLVEQTIAVFCLYVLTFENTPTGEAAALKRIFRVMWSAFRELVETGSEQNVEYWYEDAKSCYVRVPWDIYMITLAAHHEFRNAFSSTSVQHRLRGILEQVRTGGFLYSHSGKHLSSRTNGILFEALGRMYEEIDDKRLSLSRVFKDSLASLLKSVWTRWIIRIVLIGLVVYSILAWHRGHASFADLAPDLIATAIAGLLTWKT